MINTRRLEAARETESQIRAIKTMLKRTKLSISQVKTGIKREEGGKDAPNQWRAEDGWGGCELTEGGGLGVDERWIKTEKNAVLAPRRGPSASAPSHQESLPICLTNTVHMQIGHTWTGSFISVTTERKAATQRKGRAFKIIHVYTVRSKIKKN